MRTKAVVLTAVVLLAFALPAHADCYGGFTFGLATAHNIPTTQEEKLFAFNYVVNGSLERDLHSTPYGAYVGCRLPGDFAVEGANIRGISASGEVRGIFGVQYFHGILVLGIPFHIHEEAHVEAYQLSALWNFPPHKPVTGFIRIGGAYAFGTARATLVFRGQDLLSYDVEREGLVPYAGLGLQVRQKNGFHVRLEYQLYPPLLDDSPRASIVQASIGFRFSTKRRD